MIASWLTTIPLKQLACLLMLVPMALGLFCPTSIRTARCEMLPTLVVPSHPLNRGILRPNGKHWPWYGGVRDSVCTSLELITDHKALEIICSPKSKPSARIERWARRLQQYEYNIKSFTSEVLKTQQIFCHECHYQLASPNLMLQMSRRSCSINFERQCVASSHTINTNR